MKQISNLNIFSIFIIILLVFSNNPICCLALTQSSSIEFKSILDLSDTSKKKMLYFEQKGCIPCERMKATTFKNPTVAEYYNENFKCIKVHVEGSNNELSDQYNVKFFPSFVFLDEKGKVYYKAIGFFNAEDFISQGSIALLNINENISLRDQFITGNNNPDFLYKYSYSLLFTRDDYAEPMQKYLNTQSEQDLENSRNIQFLYDFMVDGLNPRIEYASREFDFITSHKDLFYSKYDTEQVDNRILAILYDEIFKAIDNKDSILFNKVFNQLKKFESSKDEHILKRHDGSKMGTIRGIYLASTAKMEFFKTIGDKENYYKSQKAFDKKIWNNANDLNNYARDLVITEEFEAALPYIQRSLQIKHSYESHFIYGTILKNLQKHKEATTQFKLAMSFVRKGSNDYNNAFEQMKAE